MGISKTLHLKGSEFLIQFFVIGIFLYALTLAVSLLWYKIKKLENVIFSIFFFSLVAALLIAHDAYESEMAKSLPETTIWSMIYSLLTKRQAIFLLSILTFFGAIALIYVIVKTFFTVSYDGAGIQIKFPGQTSYFLPVYPQMCWQKTGITINKGDQFKVELSGLVSPGGLLSLDSLREYTESINAIKKDGNNNEVGAQIKKPDSWPYSGPCGYDKKWYHGDTQLDVLKNHEHYSTPDFYKEDKGLTVMGLTHNTVLGIILNENEESPLEAQTDKPAYKWEGENGRSLLINGSQLINLSSEHYPITIKAKRSGMLWVTINDVDYARWDNTGLFFLKLTKSSWLK